MEQSYLINNNFIDILKKNADYQNNIPFIWYIYLNTTQKIYFLKK